LAHEEEEEEEEEDKGKTSRGVKLDAAN